MSLNEKIWNIFQRYMETGRRTVWLQRPDWPWASSPFERSSTINGLQGSPQPLPCEVCGKFLYVFVQIMKCISLKLQEKIFVSNLLHAACCYASAELPLTASGGPKTFSMWGLRQKLFVSNLSNLFVSNCKKYLSQIWKKFHHAATPVPSCH